MAQAREPAPANRGWLVRAVRAGWARRVRWSGFLRRQRRGAVLALLALLPPLLVVLGWRGPLVRIMVLAEFDVHPWPAACFLVGLAVAVVCVGAGSSPLPRRQAWPAVVLAAAGLPAAALFLGYLPWRWLGAGVAVGLGLAVIVLAIGFGVRRMGWGMTGFALVYTFLALLIMMLTLSRVAQPRIGTVGWDVALATRQLTYAMGYLVFLVITLTAPVGLLSDTATRHGYVRRWSGSPRYRRYLSYSTGVLGIGLLIWLLVTEPLTPWGWVAAAVAALAVIAAVRVTARRPLLDRDERVAGWWVAVVVTLPYAVLLPVLVGGSPKLATSRASTLQDWCWVLLVAGAVLLGLRRRRLTSGATLLLMVALIEILRRFGHIMVDLKATVCVVVLVVSGWEIAARRSRRTRPENGAGIRSRLALLRAGLLALLLLGLLGLVPDGVATQLLFGVGVVLAFVLNLLIDQPGRDQPIPLRGAAYLRAAGWAVAVVGAQGVMLAANGLTIANGSQTHAANLLTLPLLVLYAGFRRPGAPSTLAAAGQAIDAGSGTAAPPASLLHHP